MPFQIICSLIISFNYNIVNFIISQITGEIEELYKLQASQNNINFTIKVSESLSGKIFRNDKQRIVQLLVNLLNNAIKFTSEGVGQQYIDCQVKDNGIGIDEHKFNKIQNCLQDTIEFGAVMKSHSKIKQPGLGLIIAAKLIEDLTESKDNKLIISSKKNKGKMVQFQVENLQHNNLVSSHFPNQQIQKLNPTANQSEYNSLNLNQNKIDLQSDKTINIENYKDFQDGRSESFITLRLNDLEIKLKFFYLSAAQIIKRNLRNNYNQITFKMKIYSVKNVYTFMIFLLITQL